MRLIQDGIVERGGVAALAATLGYSQRHLDRVLTAELGAGPLALARAYRAHTARVLIQTTKLPMSDIAFAAGFSSIRQFNETIREIFAVSPSTLRAGGNRRCTTPIAGGAVAVRLPWRKPYHRDWTSAWLCSHAVAGVESWVDDTYRRSLRTPHGHATVALRFGADRVDAELTLSDLRDLAPTVYRLRHLLDLDADPVGVDTALTAAAYHYGVASAISTSGIRILGCVDAAELVLRTMIGQQISLAAASTRIARLVEALGEPIDGPIPYLFPTAEAVAEHGTSVLTGPKRRIRAIVSAAEVIAAGKIELHPARPAADVRQELLLLDGIGPWTADYVTMRLLAAPDILMNTDLLLRRGADLLGISLADTGRWSPWRSYLSMHLWRAALAAGQQRRFSTTERNTAP